MWLICVLLFVFVTTGTLSYDLSGVISGNRMGSVPLGRSLGDGELDVEGICSAPGTTCQDCTHAVTCVALPVGWLKVPLTECNGNETCNSRLGGCSKEAVPECETATQKFEHICEQVGIFPDAFDCRKFHLCSPPAEDPVGRPAEHRAALCPQHYAYDPHTAQCSIRLKYGQCEKKPVPDCKAIGQSDVLESSPNHYYICLSKGGELFPRVFICPHGWYFWGGFCRPEPEPQTIKDEVQDTEATNQGNDTRLQDNEIETPKPEPKKKRGKKNRKVLEESEESSEPNPKVIDDSILEWFSPKKKEEYPADTFLADRYDFSHLDPVSDDGEQSLSYENHNSFESGLSIFD